MIYHQLSEIEVQLLLTSASLPDITGGQHNEYALDTAELVRYGSRFFVIFHLTFHSLCGIIVVVINLSFAPFGERFSLYALHDIEFAFAVGFLFAELSRRSDLGNIIGFADKFAKFNSRFI
jgi:hypothetical protein